jgi:hypothetical protein
VRRTRSPRRPLLPKRQRSQAHRAPGGRGDHRSFNLIHASNFDRACISTASGAARASSRLRSVAKPCRRRVAIHDCHQADLIFTSVTFLGRRARREEARAAETIRSRLAAVELRADGPGQCRYAAKRMTSE